MFEVQARTFRSAKYWYSQIDHIDMVPEYQRQGGIWSDEDQSFLIDSILNDYDIPKLYLADFTTLPSALNEDRKRFAVIDGKQRLEALFRFFDNTLPLSKKTIWVDDPALPIGGLYYGDLEKLHSDLASKIAEYPLPIMHVVTNELERINELFVRLNKGSNLTGAEKRNAMIGPVPKIIKRLSLHSFFKDYVRYKANRGQNLNAAAKLLRFELAQKATDTKKTQLDEMVRGYESLRAKELEIASDRVVAGLNDMCAIFRKGDTLLANQGTIPVYYLLVKTVGPVGAILREFLLSFEQELRETRKAAGDNRPSDLVIYDNAMRSTNDGWSYEVRLTTLVERFKAYAA